MIRDVISGGSYCECQPGGAWMALINGSHFATSHGRVELLYGIDVLFARLAPDGVQIAGQGHEGAIGGHAMLWTGSKWEDRGHAGGVSPCAFWPDSRLAIATPDMGSQGIRFITDRIYTGDDTYGDPILRLNEWTRHGDVTIGQGMDTGGVVLVQQSWEAGVPPWRKRLADGACFWIRFNRSGDQLAVAWQELIGRQSMARFAWFTVAEIVALPNDSTPPVPDPVPDPEPDPMPPPNALPTVQYLHATYPPAKTIAGAFNFVRRVATELNAYDCGLLQKGPGGENEVEYQGTWYSASRVCFPDGRIFKVLTDVPTTNGPTWDDNGTVDPSRYRPALPPDGDEPDDPDEPPPGGSLDAAVQLMIAAALAGVLETVESLEQRIAALEAQPAPQPGPNFPERIALKSSRGMYLRDEWADDSARFDRTSAGDGETFTVEPK